MDRAHDERVQDFQKGTKEFLDAQIAYHEKVIGIVIELDSRCFLLSPHACQTIEMDCRMKNMHSPPTLLTRFLLTFFLPSFVLFIFFFLFCLLSPV